jgi:cation diffusion facilitator CzcD-associated flavoprotein CzcO
VSEPDDVDVLIVGAGFGGLGMAIEMRRRGLGTFVVLERADDIGGTWRDNTYPGACCDVPGALYRYSFAPEAWSRRYPPQSEILDYLRRCAARHGVIGRVRLNEEVGSLRWDEAARRWVVLSTSGTWRAHHVVLALGQLSSPRWAQIDGAESFGGTVLHSARWREDVTIDGARIGVIGTGASAVQIVPRVAERASRVVVFQRSAPYVLAKADRVASGVGRSATRIFPWLQLPSRARYFVTGDVVAEAIDGNLRLRANLTARWRAHRNKAVPEGELRAATTPDYELGCKRVLFADDWYATLRRDDVVLETDGIERLEEGAVVTAGGHRHELDVLVHATGFETTSFTGPLEVAGRDGAKLADAWAERPFAHRGVTVPGFPNLHLLYGPNTNLGSNSILYMLEAQIGYVAALVRATSDSGVGALVVTDAAARAWLADIDEASESTSWLSGCTSWYVDGGLNTHNWPHGARRYHRLMRDIDLESYEPRLPVPARREKPGPAPST